MIMSASRNRGIACSRISVKYIMRSTSFGELENYYFIEGRLGWLIPGSETKV